MPLGCGLLAFSPLNALCILYYLLISPPSHGLPSYNSSAFSPQIGKCHRFNVIVKVVRWCLGPVRTSPQCGRAGRCKIPLLCVSYHSLLFNLFVVPWCPVSTPLLSARRKRIPFIRYLCCKVPLCLIIILTLCGALVRSAPSTTREGWPALDTCVSSHI